MDDDRLNMEEFLVFQALCRWLEAEQMHLVHGPYLLSKVTTIALHDKIDEYIVYSEASN